MDTDAGFLPDCDEIEGLDAPPRMSQEINPQNLADLFADDPSGNAPNNNLKAEAPLAKQVSRSMAFAGAGIDDEFEMKKLQVFVRIRPTATTNAAINASGTATAAAVPSSSSSSSYWDAENCIHAAAKHTLAIAPPEGSMAYKAGDRGQTFTFSQVFEATTTQEEYFSATAAPMVDDLLRNPQHNSVMMAYGITAAGKTYTIEGTKSAPGVLPRALMSLFDGIARHMDADSLAVRVSYCEIYNEAVYDLIEEAHNGWVQKRPALKLMEDARGRVSVAGLSEVEVMTAEEALGVLRRGAKHRQRAETGLNFSSSRSHSIFGIHLVRRQEIAAGEAADGAAEGGEESARQSLAAAALRSVKVERLGRMSFVDLAGSERAQRTGNVGIRLKESVAINSSLMTLGRCLEALRWNQQQQALVSRNGNGAAAGPLKVVPYRESKVTHLFRDALHGYGRVVLSVNVSPCAKDYDETAHVLRYASLATAIGTLQQAEAPRRTIKAVTPGALRRAKRKAAAKVAKDEAAKKAKKAAEAAEEAEKAAMEAEIAKTAAEEAEPTPSVVQNTTEDPSTTANKNGAVIGTTAITAPASPAPPSSAPAAAPACAEVEEEVVYEVMGRRLLSDEFDNVAAPDASAAGSPACGRGDADDEEVLEFEEEQGAIGADTPSTPCSDEYDDDLEGGDEDEAIATLQAQVQQLLQDLQAAEERAVLLEGEVREEVAGEMAGLLKDMEESYRERLTAEVAAAEARAAKNAAKNAEKKCNGKKKGGRAAKDIGESDENNDDNLELTSTAQAQADQHKLALAETAQALEQAQLEITSLRAEIKLYQEEAREQADRLAKAQETATTAREQVAAAAEELALVQARAEALAAALAESRRSSEGIVEDRLREQVTQLGANAAMELEMAEQQAERLRKENMSLRQQLAAAMVTLERVSSPSIPMLQRMAAACSAGVGGVVSGGNGCGAGGTPHDLALARARQAAAAEDAAAAAAAAVAAANGEEDEEHNTLPIVLSSSQGRSTGHRSTGPQKNKSRFGEEALALAAAAATGTQNTEIGAQIGVGFLATQSQPEGMVVLSCGDKTPAPAVLHTLEEDENLEEAKENFDCNGNNGQDEDKEEAMLEDENEDVLVSEAIEMEEEKDQLDDVEAALRALEEAKAEAEKEVQRLMELAQQEEEEEVKRQNLVETTCGANEEEEEEEIDILNAFAPTILVEMQASPALAAAAADDVVIEDAVKEEEMEVVIENKEEVAEEEVEKEKEENVEQQDSFLEEVPVAAEEEEEEEVKPKRRGRKKADTKKSKKAMAGVVEEEEITGAEEQQLPVVKRSRRGRKAAAAVAAVEDRPASELLENKQQQQKQEDVVSAEVPVVESALEEEVKPAGKKAAAKGKGSKRGRKPKATSLAVENEEETKETPVTITAEKENEKEEDAVEEPSQPDEVKQSASQRIVLEDSEEDDQVLSVAKPRARLQRRNVVLLDSSSDEEEDVVVAQEEEEEEMIVEKEKEVIVAEEEAEPFSDLSESEEESASEEEEDPSDDDYDPALEEKEENDDDGNEEIKVENASEPLTEATSPKPVAAPVEEPRRQTRRTSRATSTTSTLDNKSVMEKEEEMLEAAPKPAPPAPAAAAAPAGRKRRLLQVSKPLSTEMRSALGELAGADLPGGASIARKGMPMTKRGASMAVALGLSPAPARQKSPKRSRRPVSNTDLE